MDQRFFLVSGKTLEDLTDILNTDHSGNGRVIFIEKTRSGYTAMIDTYALVVATVEDIMNAQAMEEELREQQRDVLRNANMTTIKAV